jgi:hypothetical protein
MNEAIQYHTDLFNETISNFEKMFNVGQIDEKEYNQLLTNAYLELQERIAGELGIEEKDVEELVSSSYSDDYESAEFSVGNRFGAALLELGEEAGYDDLEDYCEELGKATGNDPADIFGLITGECVPDNELVLQLNELFQLSEEYQADLLIAGIEARGEDVNDYLDEGDEEDEETEEDEIEEASYSRVNQLEKEMAEFKYESVVRDTLSELTEKAYHLVEAGYMPPVIAETLFGNFSLESDRIAAFSQVCNLSNVSPEVELYALEKILSTFEHMPQIQFGYTAQEAYTDEEYEEEKDLSNIAATYVKNLRRDS